jgi:hypothetical protein
VRASEYPRSVQPYFGTATFSFSSGSAGSTLRGNVQSGCIACSQLSPPPYDPPETTTRPRSRSGNVLATSADSHCVSRISASRLLSWIVPLGRLAELPAGVAGCQGALSASVRKPRAV